MELNKVVAERRSIRAYTAGTEISVDDLKTIISFAQNAPSWKNSQTGRYYVVSGDKIEDFRKNCLPEFNQRNTTNAPAYIVTTFEKSRAGFNPDGNPTNELGDEWGAYDLGLQNCLLILKARELGYDTLIMGIRDNDAIRKFCSVPDSQEVVAVISVGKRDIEPQMPKRKELDEIAKFI